MYGNGISYYTNDDIKLICEINPKNKNEILAIDGILNGENKFQKMGVDIIRFVLAIVDSDDKSNPTANNIVFIETGLYEYVINRLKKKAQEDPEKDYWFDFVPGSTRIAASKLYEIKKGEDSRESCLHLINLWEIMDKIGYCLTVKYQTKRNLGQTSLD